MIAPISCTLVNNRQSQTLNFTIVIIFCTHSTVSGNHLAYSCEIAVGSWSSSESGSRKPSSGNDVNLIAPTSSGLTPGSPGAPLPATRHEQCVHFCALQTKVEPTSFLSWKSSASSLHDHWVSSKHLVLMQGRKKKGG